MLGSRVSGNVVSSSEVPSLALMLHCGYVQTWELEHLSLQES